MSNATQPARAVTPPTRGFWSVFMLLALVLAITAQLVTGFAMMAHFDMALLIAHLIGGVAAIALIVAEWLWLAGARAGRYRLRQIFAADSGPAEWSEAAFLIVATVTVLFGDLLAAEMYFGAKLLFAILLIAHQALAITVAVLYLIHSAFATRRARRRRGQRNGSVTQ